MLSSITPLGQRGRGMSWSRTVIAFWVGAIVAATATFSIVGLVGSLLGLGRLNPWFSLMVLLVAAVLDVARIKPPGSRRQVDENWAWSLSGLGGRIGVRPAVGGWFCHNCSRIWYLGAHSRCRLCELPYRGVDGLRFRCWSRSSAVDQLVGEIPRGTVRIDEAIRVG